jgi:uncharacterized membrane protein
MVLIRTLAILALFALIAVGFSPNAEAHKNHQQEKVEENETAAAPAPGMTPGAMHERMEEHMEDMEEARPQTFSARLMSWVGRTHPFAVHFPIALFPVSLIALILARRRGEAVELIRALIIVAGGAAVIAGALGWLTGGFVLVDRDAIQLWHRWIGTGLAVAGGALALWAWRRRDAVNSTGMVVALSLVTLALLVQGWLGAALVHGMDHMNF